jgi:choline monooxygenase
METDVLAVRRPLRRASTLPASCYTSPEWYAQEVERIFLSEWICVGRNDQVQQRGDYYTVEVAGEPLLIVRDEHDVIRAHSAVCRHRGTVVADGVGNCRAFQCPYHNWTYALSGELLGTPGRPRPMDDVDGFDRAQYGLLPIRTDSWGGFIFVNIDGTAPDLHTWLGDLPERLKNYGLEDLRCTNRATYHVDCNWKVYLENAFESYHVATVHRKQVDPSQPPQAWTFEEPRGPYEAMYGVRSLATLGGLPVIEGLSPKEREGMYHVWVHPSLQLILTPNYVTYREYFPEGPERLRLSNNWCFPMATVTHPDFEERVGPAYYARYAEIIDEDVGISPVVQRGLRSRLYRPGRYSPQEHIVHKIANYVVDRVLGPTPGR